MIDSTGEFGLDPDKIYYVLRPAESLRDPECIKSFKLVPWIDNHLMLGGGENRTPAEEKGVRGTTGEQVYFDENDQTLKSNLKIFAENLKAAIDQGKRELSLGYGCEWKPQTGNAFGQAYQFVQKDIRGNHIASVDEGRMGSDVAVLDSKDVGKNLTIIFDSKELTMNEEAIKKLMAEMIAPVLALIKELQEAVTKPAEDAEEKPAGEEKPVEDEEEKPAEDAEDMPAEDECEDAKGGGDTDKGAMDAANAKIETLTGQVAELKRDGVKTIMVEVGKRDSLAAALSNHIGVFDHAAMTLDDVAVYGAAKLGIECAPENAGAMVAGFLHQRTAPAAGAALDSAAGSVNTEVDDFIKS
jgi:hypothetical protein